MSATGYEFKCPKCGESRSFTASLVLVAVYDLEIDTEKGWDYYGVYSESEISENADLTCGSCGYVAPIAEFEEEA